ncbi:hypothetical protein B0H21DRAFT_803411 [Amylocystis lapponica]|nr:hypothetical protein B0H21DRAFT_803411 [Amylocystis lapponica]
MDSMQPYDAIVFPADDRPPHLVALMTSALAAPVNNAAHPFRANRMPHPEMYMDYIAEGLGHRAWHFHVVAALDQMNQGLPTPFIIFYPIVSRDGMPFPVNKCIREIQGSRYNEARAWRGNIVIAKYRDPEFSTMMDTSMADFPIVKNYLSTHPAP